MAKERKWKEKSFPSRRTWSAGTFNKAVTALKATETSDNTYEVARYNAAGQRVSGEQKGLNIIKLSDGRTLKVMVP